MMANQLQRYQTYSRYVQRLVVFSGLWPCVEKSGALYRHLPIVVVCSGTYLLCLMLDFCRRNITNLHLVTKYLSSAGSTSAVILKAVLFFVYRDELSKLWKTLEFLLNNALKNSELEPVVLSLLRFFYHPAYLVSFLSIGTSSLYAFSPPIAILIQLIEGVKPMQYILAIPVTYLPNNTSPSLHYQVHYLFQTETFWFIAFVTAGVDTFFGLLIFQMCGLLRTISYEFETLRRTEDCERVLKKCVALHDLSMRCRDIIQDVYGPIVFCMALTNALILCSLIFQAYFQSEGMSIGKIMLFIAYIFLKMSQTFLYAWYGTLLTSESEAFRQNVYCGNWYEYGNKSFAKGILLIILQKPLTLTASRFFNISIDFFIGIINTTVSYFFLLQTLEDSNY